MRNDVGDSGYRPRGIGIIYARKAGASNAKLRLGAGCQRALYQPLLKAKPRPPADPSTSTMNRTDRTDEACIRVTRG